ncbi:Hypothetical_protein [Hexamita inflata]|uniref:Hypothetical_protein n=1 Tax=Hexamita inflata TaxID=28002 RepID=A0AA86NUX7_9EUKA|nr:Hypothetical protein HINF_LOCUS14682 [Hexamita inflata]
MLFSYSVNTFKFSYGIVRRSVVFVQNKYNLCNLGECYNPDLSCRLLESSDNSTKFGKAKVQEVNLFPNQHRCVKLERDQSAEISPILLSYKQSLFIFLSLEILEILDIELSMKLKPAIVSDLIGFLSFQSFFTIKSTINRRLNIFHFEARSIL